MSVRKLLAAAGIIAAGVALAGASPAGAATLKCTSTESCGGATLAYAAKGSLSLSVLAPDATTNGGFGYWNEPAGVSLSGASDGTQDFTVFQVAGEAAGRGGIGNHGEYVVMYTPGGKVPEYVPGNGDAGYTAYCLSVEDLYRTVRGQYVQRWALVLRDCDQFFGGPGQAAAPSFTTGTVNTAPAGSLDNEVPARVTSPDPYQLWAPEEVAGNALVFQNVGLDYSSYYRHGYGGQDFVLDDTAFGGAGTQGLAFPVNGGSNQAWSIIGCTQPVTVFNTAYYNCPS